jgi:uncharacterized membrane protein
LASRTENRSPAAVRVVERRLKRWFGARPRLVIGIACGLVAGVAAPDSIEPALRAVIGWDVGVATFLALILLMASRATTETMQFHAAVEDEARWAFLGLMAAAALFSLFELVGPLHQARSASSGLSVELTILAGVTLLLSWLFTHTMFAVHYAHAYYGDRAAKRPQGLQFPGNPGDPDYWDFLYFSFIIGMTCQTADIQVATQPWRRLALAHGLLAFLFNAVVLALCINLLAGLL